MRILQVITKSELGGAQSVVINLANALAQNHDVLVVAGEGDGKMFDMLSEKVDKMQIPSLLRAVSPLNEIRTLCHFYRLNKQYKPDIVHLHSSKAGLLGRLAFPKAKIVYTVHGFDSIRIAYRRFLPLERFLQKKCSAIVAVSNYDKRNLNSEGISRNVHIVYNGVSVPQKLENNPFSQFSTFERVILSIARLSPPKDWHLFMKVAECFPDYAFVWIGNQEEYTAPHPKNVFFMGSLPNAGAYCEYADLFLLLSHYEGLPMTIIEAMSFGKPVVASNVGGISEIVSNAENGYSVDNDVKAIEECIKRIFQNDEVYKSFAEKSLMTYNNNLTVDKMLKGYMDIYCKIYRANN